MAVVVKHTFVELEAEAQALPLRRRADSDSLVDYCCASLDVDSCADTSCGSSSWADLSDDDSVRSHVQSWADASDDEITISDNEGQSVTLPPGNWSKADSEATDSRRKTRGGRRQKRKSPEAQDVPQQSTTIVIRQLAKTACRDDVSALLDARGFAGLFDFIYVPVDFKSQIGLGYALVNFVTADAASVAISSLAGMPLNQQPLEAELSRAHNRGLQGLIERFRSSGVMAADMPEKFKPLLLKCGRPVPFPRA